MKYAIVGSVRLADNAEAEYAIDSFLRDVGRNPTEVVSGGAKGIDTMAVKAATNLGIPTKVFLPAEANWPAYKKRNLEIAEYCDALLRIVSHKSKTYGSGWTRDRAKEMGKPTWEVVIYD